MLHHSKLREEIIKWWPALLFWGRNIYSPWPTFRENICEFCSHKKSLSYIKMTFLLMKRLNLTFPSATVNSVKKDSEPFPQNSFFILMSFIFTKNVKIQFDKVWWWNMILQSHNWIKVWFLWSNWEEFVDGNDSLVNSWIARKASCNLLSRFLCNICLCLWVNACMELNISQWRLSLHCIWIEIFQMKKWHFKTCLHLGKASMEKKTFSFGHCPNPQPPPPDPNSGNLVLFFWTSKFKI